MILELLSTISAGLFAGAAVYISLVEHPARIECGVALARTEFGESYRRGARLMGILLMVGLLTAASVWARGSSAWWLVGGVLLLSLIPYTLALIFPVNKRLLDTSDDVDPDQTRVLLVRWGRLHAVRSLFGIAAFLIFMSLLLSGASARP